MITEERLTELETLHRSESMPMKAELRELVAAYRVARGIKAHRNESDGAWLFIESPSGKRAAISVECLAAERGGIVGATLNEWGDSLPLRLSDSANLGQT